MTNDPKLDSSHVNRALIFWLGWSLLAAMLFGYVWEIRPDRSPNDRSRWDTVWSLVEYGTYEIFDTPNYGAYQQFDTIDKVVRRHDHATVSSKPPLYPTVISDFVRVCQSIVGLPFTKDTRVPERPTIPGSFNIYGKLVLFAFNLVPFLGVVYLYRRYLDRLNLSDSVWGVSLVVFSVGTLATGYLTTLNNHTQAAAFAVYAVYHLSRIAKDGCREYWRFCHVGFAVGWTASCELPAGALAAAAMIYLLFVDWKKTLLGFLPPLATITVLFFAVNAQAIGNPETPWDRRNFIPAYLQKDLYKSDPLGNPSYWTGSNKSAIDALNDHPEPTWLYFLHSTIGHHGIFSLSPILIWCVIGMAMALADARYRLRILAMGTLGISLLVFWFYVFKTTERNYGGFCHGLRWMVWVAPLWTLFLPIALERYWKSSAWRIVIWICVCVSVLSVFDTWSNPWSRSWLHRVMLYAGIINY